MISETRFAKSYNSLWRDIAPTMELFVRKANIRGYERNWPVMIPIAPPEKRALVNRIAFETLLSANNLNQLSDKFDFIGKSENIKAAEIALIADNVLLDQELREVLELSRRMCHHLYRSREGPITLNPQFNGCGIINSCNGDAVSSPFNLIEFKDGDRPFRSYEFRQLSIYAALHLNDTGYPPASMEVVNSRRGVSMSLTMDEFAEEVAGQSGYDYLREIIRTISDIQISG